MRKRLALLCLAATVTLTATSALAENIKGKLGVTGRTGLVEAVKILRGVEGIQIINFTERDVVRHRLVQKIVQAYERYEKRDSEE